MSLRRFVPIAPVCAALVFASCGGSGSDSEPARAADRETLSHGLLLALAQFEVGPDGKVLNDKPGAARLDILVKRDGEWILETLEDPDSNVFHKAMFYDPGDRPAGILTLGGTAATLKLWRPGPDGLTAERVWQKDFGGKVSRMREAEAGDLLADGRNGLAVATHDQGVVAVVMPAAGGTWEVTELDRKPDTFVHEIELGDLDGNGRVEIYATPSEPNRLDGTPQPGKVMRYDPAAPGGTVVADLGDRHAKEILVQDVDQDGTDELYVSVEGNLGKPGEIVEIRKYESGTDPEGGETVATLNDVLCRFLTPGDLDGDGKTELVAATFRSGLWLLSPTRRGGEGGQDLWGKTLIDAESSGFEHAALVADLDGDGKGELYVASDDQGEVRRYVMNADGGFDKEVLQTRDVPDRYFTWNLTSFDVGVLEAGSGS